MDGIFFTGFFFKKNDKTERLAFLTQAVNRIDYNRSTLPFRSFSIASHAFNFSINFLHFEYSNIPLILYTYGIKSRKA